MNELLFIRELRDMKSEISDLKNLLEDPQIERKWLSLDEASVYTGFHKLTLIKAYEKGTLKLFRHTKTKIGDWRTTCKHLDNWIMNKR